MRLPSLAFFVCLLALAGCTNEAAKTYSYTLPSTPGGRLCTNQCVEATEYCHQTCDLHNRQCINDVQTEALRDYDSYTRDQFASHQPIELRPRDFERTAPCDTARKSCMNDCEDHHQSIRPANSSVSKKASVS
jgi:hypothetical protein